MRVSNKYFKYDENTSPSKKKRRKILLIAAVLLFSGGLYLLVLTQVPRFNKLPVETSIDYNTEDDQKDNRDRLQIEKINLEVPYYEGDASTLEKGAWWRYPERGNPEDGGNFIISAHRFYLGLTPAGTRSRSPFYNLDKLQSGDELKVYYKNQWYMYEVTKNYSVEPTAVEIENPSDEAKLTMYTCTLAGAADGRVVIEAKPVESPDDETGQSENSGSPIL